MSSDRRSYKEGPALGRLGHLAETVGCQAGRLAAFDYSWEGMVPTGPTEMRTRDLEELCRFEPHPTHGLRAGSFPTCLSLTTKQGPRHLPEPSLPSMEPPAIPSSGGGCTGLAAVVLSAKVSIWDWIRENKGRGVSESV